MVTIEYKQKQCRKYLEAAKNGLNVSAAGHVDMNAVDVSDGSNGARKSDIQRIVVVAI